MLRVNEPRTFGPVHEEEKTLPAEAAESTTKLLGKKNEDSEIPSLTAEILNLTGWAGLAST